MAVALDTANILGADAAATATSVSANLSADVPAGGALLVAVGWDGTGTVSGMGAVSGITWTVVLQPGTVDPRVALVKGDCANLVPSGTAIQANFSVTQTNRAIIGASFTGIGAGDNTPAIAEGTGTTYTSTSVSTAAAGELVAGALTQWNQGGHTPTGSTLEAADRSCVGADKTLSLAYRIEAAAGSFTLTGNWGGASQPWKAAAGSFAAASVGDNTSKPVVAGMFDPQLVEKAWF